MIRIDVASRIYNLRELYEIRRKLPVRKYRSVMKLKINTGDTYNGREEIING